MEDADPMRADFGDMQARDPEDRAESFTIGIGRAILSNRISHFLDIRGPRYGFTPGWIEVHLMAFFD